LYPVTGPGQNAETRLESITCDTVSDFAKSKWWMIGWNQTVKEVIAFLINVDNADVNELFTNNSELQTARTFGNFSELTDPLSVRSKISAVYVMENVSIWLAEKHIHVSL
jgi:hypothetical protein